MRTRKLKTVITPSHAPLAASRGRYMLVVWLILLAGIPQVLATFAAASPPQKKPQKPYAVIFGPVWGPDDRPVYGVKVKIRRADEKKARWEVYSDRHGEFAQRVPAGKADYVIQADLKGFKAADGSRLQPGENATVHIDFDERQDTGLHLTR